MPKSQHTVYHPTFASVVRTGLTDEQREAHKATGWRMSPLPDADKATEPTPAKSPRKSDDAS